MRLSDAIALGRTLMPFNPDCWCTCAVGLAGAAIGKTIDRWCEVTLDFPLLSAEFKIPRTAFNTSGSYTAVQGPCRKAVIGELRPCWFIISNLAWAVKEKRITMDELIDWVRSVEPPEAEGCAIEEREDAEVFAYT